MEDVLDVYQRPIDPARPVVCLDETSRQLLADVRPALPVASGRPARHDPEYVRGGVVTCFLVTAPLQGWREVRVSTQRTRVDWAHCVRDLVDVHYPKAERVVLVMDHRAIRIPRPRCTRPSHRPKPSGSPIGWTSTPRPNTGVG
jgi:hypothetical protein